MKEWKDTYNNLRANGEQIKSGNGISITISLGYDYRNYIVDSDENKNGLRRVIAYIQNDEKLQLSAGDHIGVNLVNDDGVAYLEIYSKKNHYRPVLQEIDLKINP